MLASYTPSRWARAGLALLGAALHALLAPALPGAPVAIAHEGHVHPEAEDAPETREATAAPPNIVLVLVDDLGFSDLGAYGSEVATPHIDALADRGVLFSNYHSSPMCAPSRAMLMTGISSHRAGVGNLPEFTPRSWDDEPGYLGHLAPGVTTIAQRLKPLGYDTFMTGKWHLGHAPGTLPSERGFDRTFILDATGADNWEDRSYLPYTDALWYEDGERTHLPEDWYSSRNLVEKMIGYIGDREDTDAPFFAYLALQAVHIPVQAPRAYTDKYLETYTSGWSALRDRRRAAAVERGVIPADASMRPIPDELRQWETLDDDERALLATSMSVYAGMIEAMDFHVGRLIDHLKQIGEYENTVFIVTSDNGAEGTDPLSVAVMRWWLPTSGYTRDVATLGERGSYNFIGPEFANAAAAPGAWFKFTSAEGGLRVPLIISTPGMTGPRIEDGLGYATDVPATIYDFAHSAPPGPGMMSGRSLRPILEDRADAIYGKKDVVAVEAAGHSALFQDGYKITRMQPPHGDRKWRLYDLSRDPGETRDLSSDQPERFQAMRVAYRVWADANRVIPVPDDYDHIRQMLINFLEDLVNRRPWVLLIPVLLVLAVVALVWGGVKTIRRALR